MLASRLILSCSWWVVQPSLQLPVREWRIFLANVRIDLPTSQGKGQAITRCFDYWCTPLFIEAGREHQVKGTDAWDSLSRIIDFLTRLLTVASQIVLILNLSRSIEPIFAIICFIKHIVDAVFIRDLWNEGMFCSTLSDFQAWRRLIILPIHSLFCIRR
jgi:hypothetical protein